jgi:hypothetical protein
MNANTTVASSQRRAVRVQKRRLALVKAMEKDVRIFQKAVLRSSQKSK